MERIVWNGVGTEFGTVASELEIEIGKKLKELGPKTTVVALGHSKASVYRVVQKLVSGWKPEDMETYGETLETRKLGNLET